MAKQKYNKNRGNKNKDKDKRNWKDKDKSDSVRDAKEAPESTDMNKLPWYMANEVIARNYDYALEGRLGIPTNLSDTKTAEEKIPTVMSFGFINTPGDTSRDVLNYVNPSQAAINLAAKNFYVKLSAQNKKTTQYQPQDIALAILAENQLVSMFASAVRLFGLGLQMNPKNADVPRELIRATGIDPDTFPVDVSGSGTGMTLTEFRDAINVLAQAANALPFVGGICEFEKSWAMFVNYYCDDPVDMAQYYVPYMEKFMYYKEEMSTGDSPTLVKTMIYEDLGTPESPISVKSFVNKLKKCIDALVTSSLMNYVYPDILNYMLTMKAQPFLFPLLSDMYVSRPVYNETFLNQIHNLNVPGVATFGDITQDPTRNIIETHITYQIFTEAPLLAQYVDFLFTNNPTLEEKIDACAFKVPLRGLNGSSFPKAPAYQSCLDWIPQRISLLGCGGHIFTTRGNAVFKGSAYEESMLSEFSKFKAAPIIYVYDQDTHEFINTVGDISTFGIMTYSDIKPIHDQSLLGLFTYDAARALKGSDESRK